MKKIKISFKSDKCKGCGLCTIECKQGIIKLSDEINQSGYHPIEITDMSKCSGCLSCAISCPEGIIEIIQEEE